MIPPHIGLWSFTSATLSFILVRSGHLLSFEVAIRRGPTEFDLRF